MLRCPDESPSERRLFVQVSDQVAEPARRAEGSLDYPPTRQQDKSAVGLRQLQHLLLDAVVCRRLPRGLAVLALVDIDQFDPLPASIRSLG